MKKNLTVLIATSLLLFSCKKENIGSPEPEPVTVTKKLAGTTIFGSQATFEYNSNGTFKQFINVQAWGTYRNELVHESGKITMTAYDAANNKKQEQFVFTLNAQGYAGKIVQVTYDDNGAPAMTQTTNFFYNAKGQVEKKIGGSYESWYFYDAEGNRIKTEYYNANSQLEEVTYFEYHPIEDKQPFVSPVSDIWTSWSLPPASKKLLSKVKKVNVLQNKVNYEESITYELDAQGYVVKGIVDEMIAPSVDWGWTNTWQ